MQLEYSEFDVNLCNFLTILMIFLHLLPNHRIFEDVKIFISRLRVCVGLGKIFFTLTSLAIYVKRDFLFVLNTFCDDF